MGESMDADLLPELSGETWVASVLIEEFTADLLPAGSNVDLIVASRQDATLATVREWIRSESTPAWAVCAGFSPELRCWRLQVGNLSIDTDGRLWRRQTRNFANGFSSSDLCVLAGIAPGCSNICRLMHSVHSKEISMPAKAFNVCDMKFSPTKTIIAPKTTTILGWIWSNGSINASPHRIATLSTCAPRSTVRGLHSFIGAYKVLARVIPQCSSLITPLDDIIAGCQSQDKIIWSDDTHAKFTSAQHALSSNKCITLPRPSDVLCIVADGAVKTVALGLQCMP